jgi:hypothetical protein
MTKKPGLADSPFFTTPPPQSKEQEVYPSTERISERKNERKTVRSAIYLVPSNIDRELHVPYPIG